MEAQLIGKIHVRFRGICLKYFYCFYIALNETDETESACLICRLCDKLIMAYCFTLNLIRLIKQPFSIEYVYTVALLTVSLLTEYQALFYITS